MSNALNKIVPVSSTRVRLLFSEALLSGAFVAGLYALSDLTLAGAAAPAVKAALAVASDNTQVELVLSSPLAGGHGYAVQCTSVPGADSTSFTGSVGFTTAAPSGPLQDAEPARNNADDWAFGRDLVHTGAGGDYLEDASGDLVPVSGLPNVQGALFRRVTSYSLPWDQTYGPKLDDDVDGPEAAAAPATGRIKQQVLSDDRVSGCQVTFDVDADNGAYFAIAPTLLTDAKVKPFNVALSQLSSSAN